MPEDTSTQPTSLTLGWEVTPTLEPRYWLNPDAKPGSQNNSDLVNIPAARCGTHTAIIAQSGSGKSAFLGCLIEELVLKTKARCLIFDPNADFRQIHRVDEDLWKPKPTGTPKYDLTTRKGKLPHEDLAKTFSDRWQTDGITIKTNAELPRKHEQPYELDEHYEKLRIWWPAVFVDFFVEGANPTLRSQLYSCHIFVKAIAELAEVKVGHTKQSIDLIESARDLLEQSQSPNVNFAATLKREYPLEEFFPESAKPKKKPGQKFLDYIRAVIEYWRSVTESERAKSSLIRALKASKYITPLARRFYFSIVDEFNETSLLETDASKRPQLSPQSKRVEIIDLPSIVNRPAQLLAINALLQTEWDVVRSKWAEALAKPEYDDTRVPTFIVVDEAHNLMPAEPEGRAERALRDQFRRIVAEGRKYGLFLILVSQRPDKLDPLIVSECENRVVMKLSSRSVLDKTRQMLGLDDIPDKILDRCLEFELGRALLMGNWVPKGPQFMYCAPRRTVEGGRNLREKHWAVPFEVTQALDERGKTVGSETTSEKK